MTFYTQQKERSHRFVLALRMGLPIFLLSIVSVFLLILQPEASLTSFIFLTFILLAMGVYYLFFLINQSAYETITDPLTHTFTNDYFEKLFYSWYRHKIRTIMMISVDNLTSINEQYGVKNGDLVLNETIKTINEFFFLKGIKNLPICRYKGGDMIVMLRGEKSENSTLLELFLAKYKNTLTKEIEVHLSCVLMDTKAIKKYEEIVIRLYELLYANKEKENNPDMESVSPAQLEKSVLKALEMKKLSIAAQKVFGDRDVFYETHFKLIDDNGNFIHQSHFVPLLNRLGKIRQYEELILESIISLSAQDDKKYAIIFSAATLRNGLFFNTALELLQQFPKAKNKLILLFDEKEYFPQMKRFSEQLGQYRAVGYKIGLDKYGSNHNTMMYLKEFHIDIIRFDSVYARHINEENYQNILHGLNISAHLCGASTWIGTLESEQSDVLAQQLKINYRSGNYLEKVIPLSE